MRKVQCRFKVAKACPMCEARIFGEWLILFQTPEMAADESLPAERRWAYYAGDGTWERALRKANREARFPVTLWGSNPITLRWNCSTVRRSA